MLARARDLALIGQGFGRVAGRTDRLQIAGRVRAALGLRLDMIDRLRNGDAPLVPAGLAKVLVASEYPLAQFVPRCAVTSSMARLAAVVPTIRHAEISTGCGRFSLGID